MTTHARRRRAEQAARDRGEALPVVQSLYPWADFYAGRGAFEPQQYVAPVGVAGLVWSAAPRTKDGKSR